MPNRRAPNPDRGTKEREVQAQAALATAFAPRSVAVAGVSARNTGWGGGQSFLRGIRNLDRVPEVHALNPRGGELEDGTVLHRSLAEVPGDVDYLISAVPAQHILGLIEDAAEKGVPIVHLFTAGFGETGQEERADLEAQLVELLDRSGIRLIGPNCMGIHSTRGGVSFAEDAEREPGSVGMLSQSGMNATEALAKGKRRGVRFSNVVSFGNGTDLNEADYLEFLEGDADTELVIAYIEGFRNGPRFLEIARRMSKPLAVLKGGLTESGSRAASSHTGSLAGSREIWEAVQRQTGLMAAETVEQLLDIAVTHERMPEIAGARCAVLGGGGGVSVLAADIFDRAEIPVPWFSEQTQRALAEFTPLAGTSVRNPLDAGFMFEGENLASALTAVAEDPNIDWLMIHTGADSGSRGQGDDFAERWAEKIIRTRERIGKPLAIVVRPAHTERGFATGLEIEQRLNAAGIPIYNGLEACATAVAKYLDWKRHPARG